LTNFKPECLRGNIRQVIKIVIEELTQKLSGPSTAVIKRAERWQVVFL
jgi:hypothetical protein